MAVARIQEHRHCTTTPEDTDVPENSLGISLHAQSTAGGLNGYSSTARQILSTPQCDLSYFLFYESVAEEKRHPVDECEPKVPSGKVVSGDRAKIRMGVGAGECCVLRRREEGFSDRYGRQKGADRGTEILLLKTRLEIGTGQVSQQNAVGSFCVSARRLCVELICVFGSSTDRKPRGFKINRRCR